MGTTYDEAGNPVADDTASTDPTWQDVRTGNYVAESGQTIEADDQTGAPAVTLTVTNKGSNLLGLAFLAAALYFLMSGSD